MERCFYARNVAGINQCAEKIYLLYLNNLCTLNLSLISQIYFVRILSLMSFYNKKYLCKPLTICVMIGIHSKNRQPISNFKNTVMTKKEHYLFKGDRPMSSIEHFSAVYQLTDILQNKRLQTEM